MRKKTATKEESKSIKTFFLYTALVFLVIGVSLAIKAVTVIQNSKYDGEHQFNLALAQNDKVEEIISFNPSSSLSLLKIKDSNIRLSSVGKDLAVPLDGKINVASGFPWGTDVTETMTTMAWRYNMITSDITIYDILRFVLLSKKLSTNDQLTETIKLPQEERQLDKTIRALFTDTIISSENTSIQILNATDTPGMGKRLERILVNIGANVVAVSTMHKKEAKSKLQYYGEETYTLERLKNMLQFPTSKLPKETIADIIIVIGEDQKGTGKF